MEWPDYRYRNLPPALQGGVDERCSVGEAAPSTGPQGSEAGQVQAFVGVDLSEADDSV